ncbi:hypothetical protein Tco_0812058 [Tanacetum coccineum]
MSQPSPLKRASSRDAIRLIHPWFTREEMRIHALELLFAFPCEFRSLSRVPMNFDDQVRDVKGDIDSTEFP